MEKPVIEVIIPTYRPDSQVIELVRRLKKQTVPPDRIHMIDTRSGSFPEELEEDPGIKLTRIEPCFFIYVRNTQCITYFFDKVNIK